jgi:hypothetical protein
MVPGQTVTLASPTDLVRFQDAAPILGVSPERGSGLQSREEGCNSFHACQFSFAPLGKTGHFLLTSRLTAGLLALNQPV